MESSLPPQPDVVASFATTVLRVLQTAFPYHEAVLFTGDQPVPPVRTMHPAFHGSVDWHSCVHMQWSALRLLDSGMLPDDLAERLHTELDQRLVPAAIAAEVEHVAGNRSFERPYGWAWLIMLASQARASGYRAWAEALQPLVTVFEERFTTWLPTMTYPVRHGVHSNSAFALCRLLDAAQLAPGFVSPRLIETITERSTSWFGADRDSPVHYEPCGSDFLSPSLTEAELMTRVLPTDRGSQWLADFLPGLGNPRHPLLSVPTVSDPTDGHGAHLLGLALSRARGLRRLTPLFPDSATVLRQASDQLATSASAHITEGDFMATHWLVTFALLAEDVC